MRLDHRFLGWGVFLIALGAVPLAVSQGYASGDAVSGAWRLWPLLLIGAGLSVLLRGTAAAALSGLLVAGTVGVMLGGVLAGDMRGLPFASCGDDQGATAFPQATGELTDGASVEIELNCGEVAVGTAEGTAWRVEGTDEDGEGPRVESSADAVRIGSREDGGGFDFLNRRDRWAVTLPTVPVDLDLTVNAGRGTLDLGNARLRALRVSGNAGEVRLDLTDTAELAAFDVEMNAGSARVNLPARSVEGSLSVNAGSVDLCAPPGAGLRITTNDNITASTNFADHGLTRDGNTWQTAGFDTATTQIVLDTDVNAGGLQLNPEEGCNA
jgi:hypothetical protein